MRPKTSISSELVLHRHRNGVRLSAPCYEAGGLSIAHLLQKQVSVFFQNCEHEIFFVNPHMLNAANVASERDLLFKTISVISNNHPQVLRIHQNNLAVLNFQQGQFFDEGLEQSDEGIIQAMSYKTPWYDANDQLIGIFGFACFQQSHCGSSSSHHFAELMNQLVISPNPVPQPSSNRELLPIFTARESEIIHWTLRGKTIRESAERIGISARTAESYLTNVKNKLGVDTRSELFDKLLG